MASDKLLLVKLKYSLLNPLPPSKLHITEGTENLSYLQLSVNEDEQTSCPAEKYLHARKHSDDLVSKNFHLRGGNRHRILEVELHT